jgi:hypothetical protein
MVVNRKKLRQYSRSFFLVLAWRKIFGKIVPFNFCKDWRTVNEIIFRHRKPTAKVQVVHVTNGDHNVEAKNEVVSKKHFTEKFHQRDDSLIFGNYVVANVSEDFSGEPCAYCPNPK